MKLCIDNVVRVHTANELRALWLKYFCCLLSVDGHQAPCAPGGHLCAITAMGSEI